LHKVSGICQNEEQCVMMKQLLKSFLVTVAIAGSVMPHSASAMDEPGLGTIVPEGEMTMFCQKAAAARFEVQPDAITTNPPVEREGRLLVLGTVESDDTDEDAGFDCRFEKNGSYLGIIGAPGE